LVATALADSFTALVAFAASVFAATFASAACFTWVGLESDALAFSNLAAAFFFYSGVPFF